MMIHPGGATNRHIWKVIMVVRMVEKVDKRTKGEIFGVWMICPSLVK